MTDLSGIPTTIIPPEESKGRSLFQLAVIRFRRNYAAMAGCVVLLLITLFSFFGPYVISHKYDEVFPSYVNVPPSLEALPRADTLDGVMKGVTDRARVEA